MYEPLRRRMLALLKVPPQPHPPMGDPASLRVFHAGRNYLRLRLTAWAAAQLIALAAIVFWTTVLLEIETNARSQQTPDPVRPATGATSVDASRSTSSAVTPPPANTHRQKDWAAEFAEKMNSAFLAEHPGNKAEHRGRLKSWWRSYKQIIVAIGVLVPTWAFPFVWALKIFGFLIYLIQLPVTYVVRRLDYEMRWYMVTDRSLRIRYGVWKVSESTMSFANIQQVALGQGPLQRLLGLADVKVQSAGGGGGGDKPHHQDEDMHRGLFHSVTNAPEIRDLILERLRQFRATGLGDHDDHDSPPSAPAASTSTEADTLAAAHELLAEARALRAAVS